MRNLFEHLDGALGVLRNDRFGRSEFEALAQKSDESLRDFARRVQSTGMLVYHNVDAEERDELFRERFLEGLYNPELLEVLLRENTRTFRETVDRAVDLGAITESICSRPNKRVDALRVTQEMATVNSGKDLDEMKQQVNETTVAMNSLTEMTRFVSALVSGVSIQVQRPREPFRCFECGIDGHIAKDCPRRNHLNLRGPGDRRRS